MRITPDLDFKLKMIRKFFGIKNRSETIKYLIDMTFQKIIEENESPKLQN